MSAPGQVCPRCATAGALALATKDALEEIRATAVKLGAAPPARRSPGAGPVLSARERQVLVAIAGGMEDAEVARHLFVAVSTVKTHVTRLFEKLGAHNRAQAVNIAWQRGYLAAGMWEEAA